ncbi:hypothetical protein GCM10011374_10510 [Kocuria dechangensis]|uniref:LysM domain-containing protein n=1 Tax=Kocuria dechangensis TaxID=1176249 RepID=A0A917LQE4_9MICC|nr:hypothetical protein [Kocuria dechangensis]GGG49988.1 hypothetical protein GCM10011374_10510 [Kocuria dechangensis]
MTGRQRPASTATAALWPVLTVPLLGLGLTGCGAVLLRLREPGPATSLGLAAAGFGCAVVLLWCAASALALVAVLAPRRGRRRLGRLCGRLSPALLLRAASAVLGAQLLAAPAAVADGAASPFWSGPDGPVAVGAQDPAVPAGPPAGPPRTGSPDDGWPGTPAAVPGSVPDAVPGTVAAPQPVPGRPPLARRTTDGALTVLRGDTLWALAAEQLGPRATDAQIARAWPAWYELNRHVLPQGPDHLLPGQRLAVPAPPG